MPAVMVHERARIAALVALTLALAAVVVIVAFVRDGSTPAAARAGGDPMRVTITMRDFRYAPQVVRTSPGVLTIELRNAGRLGHAFHVRKGKQLWIEERRLLPGERRIVRRRLEPGDYRAFDPLSNFEELGMNGTLVVR